MAFDFTAIDPSLALVLLFFGAAIASTLIPLQSEALLIAALFVKGVDPTAAVLVAGLGNTLGGQINWLLGRYLRAFEDRAWFPISRESMSKAERWYERWGVWSLLLCWLPWVGDPLTVAAGALRTPFWLFTAVTAPVRIARYAVTAWAVSAF